MQQVLGEFIAALRQAGVAVSPVETLDALHAMQMVGMADRARLKLALGLVLAKSRQHKDLYGQLFEQYFRALGSGEDNAGGDRPEQLPAADAAGGDIAAIASPLGQLLLRDDTAGLSLAIADAARREGVRDIQVFTQKSRYSYAVLQRLGMDGLNRELNQLRGQTPGVAQQHVLALLQRRRQRLIDRVRDHVEQQYLLFAEQQGQRLQDDALQQIKLTHIDIQHYRRMTRLVQKAAKLLASQHGRRRKQARRGLLDVRKTIAANAAFDGVQFHTRWKSVRIDRPKLVAICDVSGSVSRVARFLLLFLYSLQDVLPRVRSFVFTSVLTEVTDCFRSSDVQAAVAEVLRQWGNMSTDYGRALTDLQAQLLGDIDRKTTVMMLGDARNNHGDGNVAVWQQVYRRSRRVIWLNPESRASWDSGDSIISQYAPYCSQLEPCNSLRDLTRILSRLLKYS